MIDVHILTLPDDNRRWLDDLLSDLDGEPGVTVRVLDGIRGDTAGAHERAYRGTDAPLVSYVDSDDRYVEGTLETLRKAILHGSFAYSGERKVDEDLNPLAPPALPAPLYDLRAHAASALWMHGIYLFRREPLLRAIAAHDVRRASKYSAWHTTLAMAVHGKSEGFTDPVPVRTVGRLWRIRKGASHAQDEAGHVDYFRHVRRTYRGLA